jgi:hypothetical protein
MQFQNLTKSQKAHVRSLFSKKYLPDTADVLRLNTGEFIVVIEGVDAALATTLLDRLHPNQRGHRHADSSSIAVDMAAGRFVFVGDTVKFDLFLRLVDGQHRLQAVVESDTVQRILFVLNLSEEALGTIDGGHSRTDVDHATISGMKPLYKRGQYQGLLRGLYLLQGYTKDQPARASFATRNVVVAKDYEKALVDLAPLRQKYASRMTLPVWSALHYAYLISPRKVRQFIILIGEGAGWSKGSAAHAFAEFLRAWELRCRTSGATKGGVPNQLQLHLATLRAIRAHIMNEHVDFVDGKLPVFNARAVREDEVVQWAAKEVTKKLQRQLAAA